MITRATHRAGGWLASDRPMARIVRNMLWLASGRGVAGVLSLVYLGIVTRTLGPAGFGQFALVLSMGSAVALFVQFDCWQALMRFGADHRHREDARALERLVGACVAVDVLGALAGAALMWGAARILVLAGYWPGDLAWTATLYGWALLGAVRSTPMGVLRLHDRFDLSAYAETCVPLVRMAGALWVMATGPDVARYLWIWAGSELAAAGMFWLLAVRTVPGVFAPRALGPGLARWRMTLREEAGLGSFLVTANVGTTVSGITSQLPVLALGGFAGPAAAGLFRLAWQINQGLSKLAQLLGRAAYAEFNHARARGGADELARLVRTTGRITLISAVVLMLIIGLAGEWALVAVAGPAFAAAYPVLLLLGGAAALDLIGLGNEPALLAASNGRMVLVLRLVVVVVMAVLLMLWLPRYGANGAGAAILCSSALALVLFKLAVARRLKGAPAVTAPARPADD